MTDKYDESEFFRQVGTVETTYTALGKTYPITVYIPDNFEHDKLMDEFTQVNEEKETMELQTPEMIEARIFRFLKKAPFKCGQVEWHKAGEVAKTKAIRTMHPEHKSGINRAILGKQDITEEEGDFLPKE